MSFPGFFPHSGFGHPFFPSEAAFHHPSMAFGGFPAPAPAGFPAPGMGTFAGTRALQPQPPAPAASSGAPGQAVGADGLVPHQDGETNVPTLTYFGNYGIAQAIRLVFVEAGAHFHEREIDNKEDWQNLKARLPWGQLPVLEVDGLVLSQSSAILRYLGRKYNLGGRTSSEQAEVDAVMEAVKDTMSAFPMRSVFMAIAGGEDPVSASAEKIDDLRKHLVKFENFLQQKVESTNIPDDAPLFFVGNSLTIADLHVYSFFHLIATFAGEHGAFENLPLLQRALDSTFHRPNVQTFLEGERAFPVVPSAEKVKEIFAMLS
eukprot:TRINITY_DN69788_c0_g1_i1.p1 TRINITY_DN69788_c0_g1~~TRINITY_DN69788_c0_g1_i1.p1  ORF type:complete len:318 (+),score=96.52 TRINITY_DN69788_c0_g1_i1:80-1033(+)